MTIILAFLTLLILVILDQVKRSRRTEKSAHPALRFHGSFGTSVIERYYHPGHCWSLIHGSEPVLVGVDDFTQRLIGPLDEIELPVLGSMIHQGEPFITLRRGKRSLTQVAPVSGTVEDINRLLVHHPTRINESPYKKGWIASIVPTRISREIGNLMKGAVAERWEEAVRMQLLHSFTPALGTVLQDGGTFIDNIGDILTDEQWTKVVHEFYPTIHSTNTEKGARS